MTVAFRQETEDVTLEFRRAVNGIIVNTLADGKPVVTTSAGQFHQ